METTSLEEFYKQMASLIPENISKEIGHFNIFRIHDLMAAKAKSGMPYNRRAYYKISLISGRNKAEYADKVIDIENN
ncbi:MAG: AraC family transcriptional regulator, partial [Cytophagales bacterium]|nr:AraC family transcriptional regulator [Cytophaga sp.]